MPKPDDARPDPKDLSYEEAVGELESIIERIEGGETGLEDSLEELRRGTALHKHCRTILDAAEQQLEEISAEQRREDDDAAEATS